jgi:nitrogen fixation NifU-like protein
MSALQDLYRQVILDHARERHGRGLPPAAPGEQPVESRQYNPLCGDEVTVRVGVAGGVVTALCWDGEGCSISQAATSVLHDLLLGQDVARAGQLVERYREMVRSRGSLVPDEAELGDAVAFAGVGRHANRVKCAMLGWTAFEDALHRAQGLATDQRTSVERVDVS